MSKRWKKKAKAGVLKRSLADLSRKDISLTEDSLSISDLFNELSSTLSAPEDSSDSCLKVNTSNDVPDSSVSARLKPVAVKTNVLQAVAVDDSNHYIETDSLTEPLMNSASSFVPITIEINPSDYNRLLTEAEQLSDGRFISQEPFCIIGLHACGDLTSTALRMFSSMPTAAAVCVVGCCYHHITEEGRYYTTTVSRYSFFNYEIIQKIIDDYGSAKDKETLKLYLTEFNEFCRRSVFEVPPRSKFHPSTDENQTHNFALKYLKEQVTIDQTKKVCRNIAKIMNIPCWLLYLLSIEEGCVLLRFGIPKTLSKSVFPITRQQKEALGKIHIKVVEEASVHITEDECQLDSPVSKADIAILVNELVTKQEDFLTSEDQFPKQEQMSSLPKLHGGEYNYEPGGNFVETPKFEIQPWEIEMERNVVEFIRNTNSPKDVRHDLKKTLYQLASGEWDDKLHKCLEKSDAITIYKANFETASILYQIMIRFSEQQTNKLHSLEGETIHAYAQALIIWDVVLNQDELHKCAKQIKKTIELSATPICQSEPQTADRLIIQPKRYINSLQYTDRLQQEEVAKRLGYTPEQIRGIKERVIGAKMYSVTTDLMLSFLDDENERRDYPIKVTEEEHDIIMLPSNKPIVVLGRSGTGKTTICLNRLWLNFRNHMKGMTTKIDDRKVLSPYLESERIHQVFITKNHALCAKMKKRFYDFVAGCQHTAHYLPHENDALPEKLFDLQHFPIFITAKQFFAMLDKSLGNEDERFFKPGVTVESSTNQADTRSLNQLFEIPQNDSDDEDDDNQARRERQSKKLMPMKEIDADEFATEIWPKISKHCQHTKIDPLLIWTEIESFIEGSTQALESKDGFLSEEDYLKIGLKQAPPLERGEVYKLFIEYQKCIKHKDIRKHRFSNGELITNMSQRLQDKPWSIHEIYIDEVQDFTQAELSVILRCCQNPNRSFLAGDTAQTIMKGILFRFEDLRSLFHNLKCTVPEVHKLTKNYRSHSSITDLASSVTELLKEYFRDDFDLLSPDESNIIGPKPLFICSKTLLDNFLLSQSTSNVSSIEFGADQVVIARDSSEQGKKRMPDYLQDEIVLNVQESKGLEFNDVLLYNFFTDTPKQQVNVLLYSG